MNVLQSASRPWVTFDPSNRQHRNWVAEFKKTGVWGRCPVRFFVTDGDVGTDLITLVQRQLVDYYLSREFN
jgi:hypothetical protein